ncbi:hypothetical protein RclHR1_00670027 [Rhizophagus clarus]|uniref:F-box domain-containing protein n=1 Tax=Rhizophagus clarus TaxID=94130 RepID=A0A2Z6S637_9GLOM|nr:hypothetical protein RclHR1_00670027 [Rhizophagus clarus]GET00384.1 hypothetical protein GLOIN_2v1784405 [Rhizophagus clarus]
MSQLTDDCLNEIFEYLEDDKLALLSCILVNRSWCEGSVKIFWKDMRNYCTSNFNTLIDCLPNESKEILYKNGIVISNPTFKFPAFNYASFCKVLLIYQVYSKIEQLILNQQTISSKNLDINTHIVAQEIFKMFMKQVTSLRILVFYPISNISFNLYPGAKDCLKNLSELHCNSCISSEFFYQLSQICFNIQSFTICFEEIISNGLVDLISVQRNVKCLNMKLYDAITIISLTNIISKHSNTITKLCVSGNRQLIPLSFITNFSNLQELKLSSDCLDFEKLQYTIFPQLQVLKIEERILSVELLEKFLKNNGKNLKEICIGDHLLICSNNSLNLAIAKFCPKLRKLSTGIKNNELETLKIIFNNCKNLESIKIWCGSNYLSEREALEAVTKYSQNIYELILYQLNGPVHFELLPEELESFFISWTNRKSQKSLSLIIIKNNFNVNGLDKNYENIKIINKYIKLGVIKKFKLIDFEYK